MSDPISIEAQHQVKMLSADANCESLTIEEIEKKYDIRFDDDLLTLLFGGETFAVNPLVIQLLRDIQRLEKRNR
jgi:hypothetical protein